MLNVIGSWTILSEPYFREMASGPHIKHVLARCICGKEKPVSLPNLLSGKTRSCGCDRGIRTTQRKTRHGDARKGAVTREYTCWQAMVKRCTKPKYAQYEDYGGRGITVCERWMKYENFLEDMGRKPTPKHSLDRSDNEGNYEPSNCTWSLPKEQRMNQRKRARIEKFTDDELIAELHKRGYKNPLRVPQHH